MTLESVGQNMEQVLVAATLVAASLAVLFVLWQSDVATALALEPSAAGNENDREACKAVRCVLFGKSLPLLATSTATLVVLLHQLCPILHEAVTCLGQACSLNDVKALAIINAVVVGLLTLGLFGQSVALSRQWRALGGLTKLFPKRA